MSELISCCGDSAFSAQPSSDICGQLRVSYPTEPTSLEYKVDTWTFHRCEVLFEEQGYAYLPLTCLE